MADLPPPTVSVSDWAKGIGLSVLASLIGGASKLSIRQSWILLQQLELSQQQLQQQQHGGRGDSRSVALLRIARSKSSSSIVRNNSNSNTVVTLTNNEHNGGSHVQEEDDDGDVIEPEYRKSRDSMDGDEEQPVCYWNVALQQQQQRNLHTSNHGMREAIGTTALPVVQEDSSSSVSSSESNPLQPSAIISQRQVDKNIKWTAYFLRTCGMMGMTFLNPLCCVLAMNYASPSILAPFSGLTLVWIIIFSGPIISEYPAPPQILAAGLITVGEVVVAVFGDHLNDSGVTVQQVLDSYKSPDFIMYCIAVVFWMGLLAYWMSSKKPTMLRRFAWGVSGGSITGFQNFLKDALTILKATSTDKHQQLPLRHVSAFIFLAVLTAFGGLLLLTACMKRFDAAYSSAMFVGSFVVSASLMSAVHYHTFDHLYSTASYVMYPVGLLILMVGVSILVMETDEADLPPFDCGDMSDNNNESNVGNDNNDDGDDGTLGDDCEDYSLRQRRSSCHSQNGIERQTSATFTRL